MSVEELEKHLASLWTTTDVARLFGVTPMTVSLWRTNKRLPTIVIPGDSRAAIRFDRDEVMKWALENKIRMRTVAKRAA